MDYESIRKTDQKELVSYLKRLTNENVEPFFNHHKGHAQIHINQSPEDCIKRMGMENLPIITSFKSYDSMQYAVKMAFLTKTKEVAKWLLRPEPTNRTEKKNFESFKLTVRFGKEPEDYIINGVDRELNEIECSCARIVLERDKTGDSPCGFYIKTMYGHTEPEFVRETGRKFSKEDLFKNDSFKDLPEMSKIVMLFRNAQAEIKTRYLDQVNEIVAKRALDENKTLRVYIKSDASFSIEYENDQKRMVATYDFLKKTDPKLAQHVDGIVKTVSAINQNLSLEEVIGINDEEDIREPGFIGLTDDGEAIIDDKTPEYQWNELSPSIQIEEKEPEKEEYVPYFMKGIAKDDD